MSTYVDELYNYVSEIGGIILNANFPRSYIDPNRAETDFPSEELIEEKIEDEKILFNPTINKSLLLTYSLLTSSKYERGVHKAASPASCPKVGGDNLACANFKAVNITSLFLLTIHPILIPHMLYLLEVESITTVLSSKPSKFNTE